MICQKKKRKIHSIIKVHCCCCRCGLMMMMIEFVIIFHTRRIISQWCVSVCIKFYLSIHCHIHRKPQTTNITITTKRVIDIYLYLPRLYFFCDDVSHQALNNGNKELCAFCFTLLFPMYMIMIIKNDRKLSFFSLLLYIHLFCTIRIWKINRGWMFGCCYT